MQDKYTETLTAPGGMTAIGGFTDLLLYRDPKRVEGFMIKWWVLFTDVKCSPDDLERPALRVVRRPGRACRRRLDVRQQTNLFE